MRCAACGHNNRGAAKFVRRPGDVGTASTGGRRNYLNELRRREMTSEGGIVAIAPGAVRT